MMLRMPEFDTLERERRGAESLIASLEQELRAVEAMMDEKRAELVRAFEEAATIVSSGEFRELFARSVVERSLAG